MAERSAMASGFPLSDNDVVGGGGLNVGDG